MPRVIQSRTTNRAPPTTSTAQQHKQQHALLFNDMCNKVNQLQFHVIQQQQTIQQLQSILQIVCVAVFPGDSMKNIRTMYTDILTSSSTNLLNIPYFTNTTTPAAIISPETVPYCFDSGDCSPGSLPCSPSPSHTSTIIINSVPPPPPVAVIKPLSKYKLKKLAEQQLAAATNTKTTIPALFNNQTTNHVTNHHHTITTTNDGVFDYVNSDVLSLYISDDGNGVHNNFDMMSAWSPTATTSFRAVSNHPAVIAIPTTTTDDNNPRPAKRKLVICSSSDPPTHNAQDEFRSIRII